MRPDVCRAASVLLLAVVWTATANAYSCFDMPFMTRVDQSENIFVARITGGEIITTGEYAIEKVSATFEVVENFKGSVAFDRLITSANTMAGGIYFVVGGEYLIFTDHTGRVGKCSNNGTLSPAELRQDDERSLRERDALRVGKQNGFRDFVAPWHFSETEVEEYTVCSLRQEIRYDGPHEFPEWASSRISFSVASGDIPDEYRPADWPQLSLTVSVPGEEDLANYTAVIRVGATTFTSHNAAPTGEIVRLTAR